MPVPNRHPPTTRHRAAALLVAALLLLVVVPATLHAWGAYGHRLAATAAVAALPNDMPKFFRDAGRQLTYLNPEPDRWRGGEEGRYDTALSDATAPDHFIDLEFIPAKRRAGVLAAESRFAFADSLTAIGVDPAKVGMLPFRVLELTQRLRAGFRLWRAAPDAETRGWIEQRIINDAGILGHYVTDGANPAHTSIHFNGWVGENPNGYATDRRFHSRFESAFVEANVTTADLHAAMRGAPRPIVHADLRAAINAYVARSNAQIEPMYRLDKVAAFGPENRRPEHQAFAAERLAAGATMLRDLWWTAWVTSAPAPDSAGRR